KRRKAARPRQSSSPPKQPIRGGQTAGGKPRAQSHQQPQSRSSSGRRGLDQLQEALSGVSPQSKDKAYQENLAKQAELQRQLSALKHEQTEKFLQGKERVTQERKSRSEQRSAVSAQSQSSSQASSSQKEVRQPTHSSVERRYSRERGPPPLEKSDRSRSRDTQAPRADSRDRSSGAGSRPSQSDNPVTEYHRRVTQETRAYQSTSMGSMPPPGPYEPRWQSSEGRGQEFGGGQGPGWGYWRGRGRGFRPRGWSGPRHGTGGGRFRWSGPRMGRPRQSPTQRQPGSNKPPPREKESKQEESSESFYGDHGEYVREEHEDSDKTITPSHSR
ncbi:MAG: hypothetical protein GY821_09470, partial [Gammaproteobacteria bacterium]|nr:hypothetical protein [Gammaproteobacteria bacterium]